MAATGEQVKVTDQRPTSPAGSTSSREDTRDARERLKKTSIAGLSQKANPSDTFPHNDPLAKSDASITDPASDNHNGFRGRPAKKRSFEDLAKDDADTDVAGAIGQPPLPKSGHHKRMRSRDINSGDHSQTYAHVESDKNHTLHEQALTHEETDMDAHKSPGGPGVLVDAPSQEDMATEAAAHPRQPNKEGHSATESATASKVPPLSGFANASAASPFGQARSPSKEKSPEPNRATSSSAFAASGLSAFASSGRSPFDAAASSKSPQGAGGFGGGQSSGGFRSTKGGFGSSTGFGSTATSGFGAGSAGFGAPKPFGASSTFGAPKPFGTSSGFGSGGTSFGTGKPIGASKDDEEDEEETGEEEDTAGAAKNDAEQDPRFHQQHGEWWYYLSLLPANEYSRYWRRRRRSAFYGSGTTILL